MPPRGRITGPKKKLNEDLRKSVIKGELAEIRKLINDGADPNYLSQYVPFGKKMWDYTNALTLACQTRKKPDEVLSAIIEASEERGIKLDYVPRDPIVTNDKQQSKKSVLHSACNVIANPKILECVIDLLRAKNVDFNYSAWHNMSAITYLLHKQSKITDPREPLKRLIKYGCDVTKRFHMTDNESEGFMTSISDDDFECPEYEYETKVKNPEKFSIYGSQHNPEYNTKSAKWAKKNEISDEIMKIMHDERNKVWKERKQNLFDRRNREWENDINAEYKKNYKESLKTKRTDDGWKAANISCQIYNFLQKTDEEAAKTKVVRKKLVPSDPKFKLFSRKIRKQKQKESREYDPDCECCQTRKRLNSENPNLAPKVQPYSTSQTLPPMIDSLAEIANGADTPEPDTSEKILEKISPEPIQNLTKPIIVTGINNNDDLKTPVESTIAPKKPLCGMKNCKVIDPRLMKCSACESISYCSQNCQKNDWHNHKRECDRIKRGRRRKANREKMKKLMEKKKKIMTFEINSSATDQESDNDYKPRPKSTSSVSKTPIKCGININMEYKEVAKGGNEGSSKSASVLSVASTSTLTTENAQLHRNQSNGVVCISSDSETETEKVKKKRKSDRMENANRKRQKIDNSTPIIIDDITQTPKDSNLQNGFQITKDLDNLADADAQSRNYLRKEETALEKVSTVTPQAGRNDLRLDYGRKCRKKPDFIINID